MLVKPVYNPEANVTVHKQVSIEHSFWTHHLYHYTIARNRHPDKNAIGMSMTTYLDQCSLHQNFLCHHPSLTLPGTDASEWGWVGETQADSLLDLCAWGWAPIELFTIKTTDAIQVNFYLQSILKIPFRFVWRPCLLSKCGQTACCS